MVGPNHITNWLFADRGNCVHAEAADAGPEMAGKLSSLDICRNKDMHAKEGRELHGRRG